MSRDELVERFDLDRVVRSPATFDYEKLNWLNGVYLRALSADGADRAREDRALRAVPRLRRLLLPRGPSRRGGDRRTHVDRRGRARGAGRCRAVRLSGDRSGAAFARRAPRAVAAKGVRADPYRRDGVEGLARTLREHRAARQGRDATAAQRGCRRKGLGGAKGSSARWKRSQARRRNWGVGRGKRPLVRSISRPTTSSD